MKSAFFFSLIYATLQVSSGFQNGVGIQSRTSNSSLTRKTFSPASSSELSLAKKPDDEKKKSEPMTLDELSRREMEASRKNMAGLLFSFRFGEIINKLVWAFGWGFVVVGVIIESQGYAYVIDNGQLRIGTIEERDFSKEMRSSDRQQKKLAKQQQRLLEQSQPQPQD